MSGTAPSTKLAAKFSLPYEVAVLMRDGVSGFEAYDEDRLRDAEIAAFQERIRLLPSRNNPEGTARAEIALNDGTILEGSCLHPFGGPGNEASTERLSDKFRELAGKVLARADTERLLRKLVEVARCADTADLCRVE
jgi:2-methylcitrate dehydratase PrpD